MARKTIKRTKTRKAPCEVCTTRKLSKKSGLYKLQSGDTHLRAYLPVDATLRENPHARETVYLEGLKPNTVFFYLIFAIFTIRYNHFIYKSVIIDFLWKTSWLWFIVLNNRTLYFQHFIILFLRLFFIILSITAVSFFVIISEPTSAE